MGATAEESRLQRGGMTYIGDRKENEMGAHACVHGAVLMVVTLGLPAAPAPARAQGAEGPNAAQAAAVFEEAKKALDQRQYDIACPKFLQSYEFDRTKVGILYALAECYADAGKVASAVARYEEYAQRVDALPPDAKARHRERAERANAQRAALAPDVPEITLVVSGAGAPGARVVLDGRVIEEASLKAPQSLDPGEHRVTVTSREGVNVERVFTVNRGSRIPIEVKINAKAPAKLEPVQITGELKPSPPDSGTSGRRIGAYSALAVGAAGLVVMGITGTLVLVNKNAVHETCSVQLSDSSRGCTSQHDVDRGNTTYTLGMVSTISLGVGLAGAALGVALLLTEPKKEAQSQAPRWIALGSMSIQREGAMVGATGIF